MTFIGLTGMLAAVLTTSAYVPQAYKVIKTRSTQDLSASAPLRAGFPMADTLGELNAGLAICAALVRQQTTGAGEQALELFSEVIFCLSRSVGILAHAWEHRGRCERNEGPIPRTFEYRYTGASQRKLPSRNV
jgi:hypothetical protein